jgi:hypothetical protein
MKSGTRITSIRTTPETSRANPHRLGNFPAQPVAAQTVVGQGQTVVDQGQRVADQGRIRLGGAWRLPISRKIA